MQNKQRTHEEKTNKHYELLNHAIDYFAHVLPSQASIRDFVHHNTLHGYQHLKFPDALKAAYDQTGAYGYWPQEKFRKAYLEDRISDNNIFSVLSKEKDLEADELLFKTKFKSIYLRDIYKIACLYPLKKITSCQLKWQIEEAHALTSFQSDLSDNAKKRLLKASAENEQQSIEDLWSACIEVLGLNHALLHPEDLLNLEAEQVTTLFPKLGEIEDQTLKTLIQNQARKQMDEYLAKVGNKFTMGALLKKITGVDIQREITPHLTPYLANWLDEGFAQWHSERQATGGFYQSWKQSAVLDETGIFNDIPDWKEHINSLPRDSIDTVIAELQRMSIPQSKWGEYITRLALELPGWSGMFYWRHCRPEYPDDTNVAVNIMDYLAVRLVLEHMFVRKYCRRYWLVGGNLATLSGYLHQHYAEFYARNALFNQTLPEYLKTRAQHLVAYNAHRDVLTMHRKEWQTLANMIWTWQQSSAADGSYASHGAHFHYNGWKLFRLAQHLGLCADEVRGLSQTQLESIFNAIKRMDKHRAGFILLQACELHYQNQLFRAISQNQGRGTWANRKEKTPEAQIFFCMDDREEGIRRHLEHTNPNIETFGAAAFFNIVLGWKGLESNETVSLCPAVLKPTHEVAEVADPAHLADVKKYKQSFKRLSSIRNFVHQKMHQGLLANMVLMPLLSPMALLTLLGKNFIPYKWNQKLTKFSQTKNNNRVTRVATTANQSAQNASINIKQQGFTIDEQTQIVESFLQENGLLSGFAPLIVIMGHYSRNQNNPHAAAYGCGACSGKFSGPNGRVFAAMANHPKVRKKLEQNHITLPDNTWFMGAEHDTCNEKIVFYDEDLLPEALQPNLSKLKKELDTACNNSAHERCRKLASAPKKPSLSNALKHIRGRAVDFSQSRPELGHATIAAGFIGRRHFSQGTFMDRRSFLISYDASVDPDGAFLERLLLSVGPVGAGISLEYYFSAVNNDYYGSGSKIVHNVSSRLGVIEGASGDLRTGLPVQMIEIHEPMRLQLMIEANTEVLTKIYNHQPDIKQLVENGWLLLSAKDPDSEKIETFDPETGWHVWQCADTKIAKIPIVDFSADWYKDKYNHLPPVLIKSQSIKTEDKAHA